MKTLAEILMSGLLAPIATSRSRWSIYSEPRKEVWPSKLTTAGLSKWPKA